MTDSSHKKSIRENVLEKIQSGSVRRRSRFYFMARIVATIVTAFLLLVFSAFVVSFILFSLHESGEQFLLGFGWQGVLVFLKLFPWLLLLCIVALLLLLEWLLQGFTFGYRMPLLNIFIGILVVSGVFGFLINATPLHGALMQRADSHQLPFGGELYEHILDPHDDDGVCRGIVTSVQSPDFIMTHNDQDHDADDGVFMVVPAPGSSFPVPRVGDRVLVFGRPNPVGVIPAQNVQVLPPIDP